MTTDQNNLTSHAPAPIPQTLLNPQLAILEPNETPTCRETLDSGPDALLLAAPSQEDPPVTYSSAESTLLPLQFATAPLQSLQTRPAAKPRNGKIAHLPKLERDM